MIDAIEIATPKINNDGRKYKLPPDIKQFLSDRNIYRRNWLRYQNAYAFELMNNYNRMICCEH